MIKKSARKILLWAFLAILLVGLIVAAFLFFRRKERLYPLGHTGKNCEPFCPCAQGWEGARCETANNTYGCDWTKGCFKGAGSATLAKCSQAGCTPCPNGCSAGQGTCDTATGQCKCYPGSGWTGDDCGAPTCPADCNTATSQGSCGLNIDQGKCICLGTWTGPDCNTLPEVDAMINGVWLEPESLPGVTAEKMNGWISDVFMGFHIDWDNDPSMYLTTNDSGVNLCHGLHGMNPSVRFWILLGKLGLYDYEIGNKIDDAYDKGQFVAVANLVAGKFSFLGGQLRGLVIDWEGGGHDKVKPGDVQLMINIYNQIRSAQLSLGLRINLSDVRECLVKNAEPSLCSKPTKVDFTEFLRLDNTWFDFYRYGSVDGTGSLGCGCDPGSTCVSSYPHNCYCSGIDGSLRERTDSIHKKTICQHMDKGRHNFMEELNPQERGRITIGSYPTSPQGVMAAYRNLWGKYHYYGYWMFDAFFIFGCSEDIRNQYRAVYKTIIDELLANPPTYTQKVSWDC